MMKPIPAIIEMAEERDRRDCIALYNKSDGANRELAEWLLKHHTYPGAKVAGWLGCNERRIQYLRRWAKNGFDERGHRTGSSPIARSDASLKTNDDFLNDDLEPSDDVEEPAKVMTNILDSIKHAKSVAEAYRKILKSSSFDREAKAEIYNAINQLIVKWRTVQSALDTKGR